MTRAGIITGAASGIGAAIARELSGSGTSLVLIDQSETVADVAAELSSKDVQVAPWVCDIADFDRVQAAAHECVDRWGQIDLLVANAGILDTSFLSEGNPDRWRLVLETNLLGTALCIRAVLPRMKDQGNGHIVLIASVSGLESYAGEAIYIASKWGVVGLGGSLRREVASSGIRTTLISPGIVNTPLLARSKLAKERLATVQPLQPEDVARVVGFVLSQPPHMAINHVVLRPAAQDI